MFDEYNDIARERLASVGETEQTLNSENPPELPHFADLNHIQVKSSKVISSLEGGKNLGQFILHKTLGRGTFGKVKLASHTPTGEKVS